MLFWKKIFIILFLERGREGERGEKHQCVVASCAAPTEDLARNPGTCPDWASKPWPFGSQTSTESIEPQQWRLKCASLVFALRIMILRSYSTAHPREHWQLMSPGESSRKGTGDTLATGNKAAGAAPPPIGKFLKVGRGGRLKAKQKAEYRFFLISSCRLWENSVSWISHLHLPPPHRHWWAPSEKTLKLGLS